MLDLLGRPPCVFPVPFLHHRFVALSHRIAYIEFVQIIVLRGQSLPALICDPYYHYFQQPESRTFPKPKVNVAAPVWCGART